MKNISIIVLSLFIIPSAFAGCKFEACRSDEKCRIKGKIAGGTTEINWQDKNFVDNDARERNYKAKPQTTFSGVIHSTQGQSCNFNSNSVDERSTARCNDITVTTYTTSVSVKEDDQQEDCRVKGFMSKGSGAGTSKRLVVESSFENNTNDVSSCEIDFYPVEKPTTTPRIGRKD